ncbi:hypothetical protein HN258_15085 [Acinetobacter baumannii]|uniref:hypothetical protein n=1 Tax=Acinetobacter baumannii TaxID=470 RepID=UPI001896EF74|nr:hypothetical protein [Acinetobacter baumannii]MBF6918458.1 hypothetical protein [Acinetobacter baumannii]
MAFYKITDAELLAKIDAIMEERNEFIAKIREFVKLVGLKDYSISHNLYFGISLSYVGIHNSKESEIDLTKWKKSKVKNQPYFRLLPRKSNKEFHKLWSENYPKGTFHYDNLVKLIIQEDYCPFTKGGLGISWKKGKTFCFETNSYTPVAEAIEILTSEYKELTKDAEE